MGKTARWFRSLLAGGKKSPAAESVESSEAQKKKKRGHGKSLCQKRGPLQQAAAAAAAEEHREAPLAKPTMARAYGAGANPAMDDEAEQNKRAVAVAAATAAVAEAAVAAAEAAASVLRLTSSGCGAGGFGGAVAVVCAEYGRREDRAAVKIQSVFRGYLMEQLHFTSVLILLKARRALRALRGLVKLQALVRGNIVREKAAETLRCMQSLIRVQARARACRAPEPREKRMPERGRRSHAGPPEKIDHDIRIGATKSDGLGTSTRNSCRKRGAYSKNNVELVAQDWLEGWLEERGHVSRASSSMISGMCTSTNDNYGSKILEVDSGKPQYTNRRWSSISPCSTLTSDQNSRSFATGPDSPSKDSATVEQSIRSPSSVDMQQSMGNPGFTFDATRDYEEERPQLYSASSRRPGMPRKGPFALAKIECSQTLFHEFSINHPNYMSNTASSKAKLRSQSAPKQRPDLRNQGSIERSASHARLSPSGWKSSSLHAPVC